ncbi:uncharacterized protein LOC116351864, partial [Contarinia nasturtii]|uniref:uncharacterized protein LOC116351864 n=1 Tax=Contarinia nasturtii TaxID=265458 RepID=UPI0012D45C25
FGNPPVSDHRNIYTDSTGQTDSSAEHQFDDSNDSSGFDNNETIASIEDVSNEAGVNSCKIFGRNEQLQDVRAVDLDSPMDLSTRRTLAITLWKVDNDWIEGQKKMKNTTMDP